MAKYVPRSENELYDMMAWYLSFVPDFTQRQKFTSQAEAEDNLYQALENVFSAEPGIHAEMKEAADSAFRACRQGREVDAIDQLLIIRDELGVNLGLPHSGKRGKRA